MDRVVRGRTTLSSARASVAPHLESDEARLSGQCFPERRLAEQICHARQAVGSGLVSSQRRDVVELGDLGVDLRDELLLLVVEVADLPRRRPHDGRALQPPEAPREERDGETHRQEAAE
jgi:hypothetical protein